MSIFSSQLLSPWWLLLGLLAIPILVLYMLKLRRQETIVSSTLLWQALLRDRQANTPWQRLKRNLLLLLQLLILAALTLALARPAAPIPSIASGSVIVLLDTSASMATIETDENDGEENTRLELATQIVQDLINGLPYQGNMTLIQVARQPIVLAVAEEDQDVLRKALAQVSQTTHAADWEAAFALATGVANTHNDETTLVILSDGGLPRMNLLDAKHEVRYVSVGRRSDNLAISAFASRSTGETIQLFTRLTNYGDQESQAVLSLYQFDEKMNRQLLSARQVTLPAGGEASVTIEQTPENAPVRPIVYQAQISPASNPEQRRHLDALPLDDAAFTVQQPFGQDTRRALLVSLSSSGMDSQIYYLQQMMTAYERVTAYQAVLPVEPDVLPEPEGNTPSDQGSTGIISTMNQLVESVKGFDLYIIAFNSDDDFGADFRYPAQGSLLLINPPSMILGDTPIAAATETFIPQGAIRVRQHPLTQFLEWQNIYIRRAQQLQPPTWLEPLVESEQGPLVLAGETNGQRVAVITFDLDDSDFPLHIDYPILFANLLNYLIPSQTFSGDWIERGYSNDSPSLLPGESLVIHISPDIEQLAIASPKGQLSTFEPTSDSVQFSDTTELGLYAVSYYQQNSQYPNRVEYFSVNLFDGQESNIRPAETVQIGSRTIAVTGEGDIGQRELWPWLGSLALIVLLIEWWIYHARLASPNQIKFKIHAIARFLPRKAVPHDRV